MKRRLRPPLPVTGRIPPVEASAAPQEFELEIGGAISAPEAFGASFEEMPASEALELGAGLEGDPAVAFRRTLGMFATGVTVLTTRVGDQAHGMTANAFMSVSLQPPLVLVSIDRRARMCTLLHEGTRFGINVLEAGQAALSDQFAGRVAEGAPEARFELVHETPLVEGALAHLVARVVRSYWGGDHSLFVGQVEFARYGEGRPLLFHGGRYERLVEAREVFAKLPRELLDPILALGEERAYGEGDAIMSIGEPGAELMLVVEGTVRIERPGFSMDRGPGSLIGEIEVLNPGGGRTANIHALAPTRCLAISRDALLGALEADPRAAIALIEVLASRFRETS
jgi:flavin reductase (DIM6/NTAB) family NADH-FMN oxidoreductase RutF